MVRWTSGPALSIARLWSVLALGLAASGIPAGETVVPAADRGARAAVEQAERAVTRARNARALWTVAEQALGTARQALANGRYDLAIEQARQAREFAELGIAQKDFPLVR